MADVKPRYKRILVKLSGEALSAGKDGILNYDFLEKIGAGDFVIGYGIPDLIKDGIKMRKAFCYDAKHHILDVFSLIFGKYSDCGRFFFFA